MCPCQLKWISPGSADLWTRALCTIGMIELRRWSINEQHLMTARIIAEHCNYPSTSMRVCVWAVKATAHLSYCQTEEDPFIKDAFSSFSQPLFFPCLPLWRRGKWSSVLMSLSCVWKVVIAETSMVQADCGPEPKSTFDYNIHVMALW